MRREVVYCSPITLTELPFSTTTYRWAFTVRLDDGTEAELTGEYAGGVGPGRAARAMCFASRLRTRLIETGA